MREHGFTLVEMIVTLTILSVLALAAMPLGETVVRHSREQALNRALADLRHALDAFKEASDTGRIKRLTDSGYPPNLDVLVDGVEDAHADKKMVYFLRQIPRDPFCPDDTPDVLCWSLRAYDSSAAFPQSGKDVFDVHSKSDAIGSDGRAYQKW